MKNKKGNFNIAGGIIIGIIALLLVANLLIPQAKTMTDVTAQSDTITAHVQDAGNTSYTLSQTPVANSLSIAGLTVSDNYSVDYTAGTVLIFNATANGTYSAGYTYEGTQYLDSATDRVLAGIIVLGAIIGLLVLILKVFGAM